MNLFNDMWNAFSLEMLPRETSEELKKEYEKAFYAGAASLLSIVHTVETDSRISDERKVEVVQASFKEIAAKLETLYAACDGEWEDEAYWISDEEFVWSKYD